MPYFIHGVLASWLSQEEKSPNLVNKKYYIRVNIDVPLSHVNGSNRWGFSQVLWVEIYVQS